MVISPVDPGPTAVAVNHHPALVLSFLPGSVHSLGEALRGFLLPDPLVQQPLRRSPIRSSEVVVVVIWSSPHWGTDAHTDARGVETLIFALPGRFPAHSDRTVNPMLTRPESSSPSWPR